MGHRPPLISIFVPVTILHQGPREAGLSPIGRTRHYLKHYPHLDHQRLIYLVMDARSPRANANT